MTNTTTLNRKLTLGIAGILSVFMFGIAYTASAATLYRQLQFGMSGSDVSDLQVFLAKDVAIYPQGLVTGYFGNLTKSAVVNFQNRNGISPVGRVGPITMAAINVQMGSDSSSPFIGAVSVSTSNNFATLNWNTNENASAVIYYSTMPISMIEGSPTTGVTIGGSSLLVHTDLRSVHSASITGLQANTTYYFVVYVRDGAGNESISWPSTFTTAQ
ncbi:MAG TPA: peptidoglycan-binding protein [Candidatus Paceibacterota bacterium]